MRSRLFHEIAHVRHGDLVLLLDLETTLRIVLVLVAAFVAQGVVASAMLTLRMRQVLQTRLLSLSWARVRW
jgi:hypothetical protein